MILPVSRLGRLSLDNVHEPRNVGTWCAGILAVAAAFAVFGYYRWRSYREFGGITGDTAGYFLTLCEGAMAVAAAVSVLI